MAASIIDSTIFGDMFSHAGMRRIWSNENRTAKYLDVERALARVQGQLGVIPQEATDEIVRNCELSQIDWARLKAKTEQIGYPIIAVVNQINANCRDKLGEYCHWGATTQDITDTATVLQMREPGACRARPGRDLRFPGQAVDEVPRHAHHRPFQPAAGHADHLRLQDGQHPGGHRAQPGAAAAVKAPRADGRVRGRSWKASATPPTRWARPA